MHRFFVILFVFLAGLASADHLNITTCFCHGQIQYEGGIDTHVETGSFIAFDYWNKHLDENFSFNITAHATGYIGGKPSESPPQPFMDMACQIFEHHAQMCYERNGDHSRGRFAFNGHDRKLPFDRRRHVNEKKKEFIYQTCAPLCILEVGLPDVDRFRSAFASYHVRSICKWDTKGICPWRKHKPWYNGWEYLHKSD